jgi:hypothetical protein
MKEISVSDRENIIPFIIEKKYTSFIDFLKNEKYIIYQKILESFEEIIVDETNDAELIIFANVEGVAFDSTFNINKDNIKLLSETVNSYFISIEDYESCDRIQKLCLKIEQN